MASAAVRPGEEPVKSALDKRVYRTLTLANDLRVFLASDPRSDIAAAALDVGVGSWSNPEDLPGLAHFLEHMLFLGTEKYPDENDFAKFLSKHGGSWNAYTASENANYHFQVSMSPARVGDRASEDGAQETPPTGSTAATDPSVILSPTNENGRRDGFSTSATSASDVLAEALDRFSQFFIAPLFTESATDRELNAVDNEHTGNLLDDGWRLGHVEAVCGNPQHPRIRFSTGNRETLCDIPAKQGIDVRAALLAFHRKYYSANLMHLCITGPQTLDQLQELAVNLFGGIENKRVPLPSLEHAAIPPLTDAEMRRVIYAQTVEEQRRAEVFWPLPTLFPGFRDAGPGSASSNCARNLDAAADLVSDLLGYEGAGSLTSYLKRQGWIEDLYAGVEEYHFHYGIFCCTIDLTSAGVEKVDEIVASIYSYIRLIRNDGVCEWIHDEISTLNRNCFRFGSRADPHDLVCGTSAGMAFLRDSELLSGRDINARYDPSYVHRLLDLLTPTRMTLKLSGKFVEKHTNKKEPIYGAEYGIEDLSEAQMSAWTKEAKNPELKIRRPNPFIASNFAIVADPLPPGAVMSREPQKLLDTTKFELHFAPDQTYQQPFGEVEALFVTRDLLHTSVTSSMGMKMAFALLEDGLNELSYDAGAASLHYSVSLVPTGVSVMVSGYNEKLDQFFVTVLERLASFRATLDRYLVIKDQFEMAFRNVAQDEPMSHATSQTYEYCEELTWSYVESLAALEGGGVSLELVNNFLASLIPVARAVIFVGGNVSADWALRIPAIIESCLDFEGLSSNCPMQMHVPRVVRLPEGVEIWARRNLPNKSEENSAIDVLYQVGEHSIEWVLTDASLEILVAIMKTPFFDDLRTKQQLGYQVSLNLNCWRNVYGMSVRIQGKKASPVEMRARIDAFMTSFRNTLCDMADEEFDKFVDAEVSVRSEPDLTFGEFTSRMEYEVFTTRQFLWDRQDREVQALQNASKDSVISLFDDYFLEGSPKRKVFTSCVYGSKHKISDDDACIRARGHAVQEVFSPWSFKSTSDLHRAQGSE